MERIYLCKFAKLVLTVYQRPISAMRIIIFLWWFGSVTSCLNSGTIQWSPLKNLRAGESLLVRHVNFPDSTRILVFRNFLKGPIQYSLVQSQQWRHQNNVPNMFKVNNKKLGWRYWPRSGVFVVVNFEHIPYIVLAFPLLALKK